jgi:hypothetical protein
MSKRAESWVHSLLNPLHDAIELEIRSLKRRDVTWDIDWMALTRILPIGGYLVGDSHHILRDFLAENAAAAAGFEKHDVGVRRIEEAAREAFQALCSRPPFGERVRLRLAEFMAGKPPSEVPHGTYGADRMTEIVAENVINRRSVLPTTRTDAKFWQCYRAEFEELAGEATLATLDAAREALLVDDGELLRWIEHKSLELCRQYDIPAAPFSRSVAE